MQPAPSEVRQLMQKVTLDASVFGVTQKTSSFADDVEARVAAADGHRRQTEAREADERRHDALSARSRQDSGQLARL